MSKKVKIGIVGFGEFSISHIEVFLNHPDIDLVVGAEMNEERRKFIGETLNIQMYSSYDEMLEKNPDINSVGIFTQRELHGPMVIQALKAGKNVFSAVPMGCTKEEIFEIIELVEKTGLTYVMAETCYYWPCAVWARKQRKKGTFGQITFAEAQYYHDTTEMFEAYVKKGGETAKYAAFPPMLYGTHSAAMLISAVGERPTEITCFGYADKINDGIYCNGDNPWNNPFSNETAIIRFESGALGRMNEFRRVGTVRPSSYITGIYGTHAAYEYSGNQHLLSIGKVFGQEPDSIDVSDEINTNIFNREKDSIDLKMGRLDYKYHTGFAPVQNVDSLPEELRYLEAHKEESRFPATGHNGSHFFTIDDFVKSVVQNKIPQVNAWRAAEYTLVGILAHESAMLGGKTLEIPNVGNPPADKEVLDLD